MEKIESLATVKCNSPTCVPLLPRSMANNKDDNKRIIMVEENDEESKKVKFQDDQIVLQVSILRAIGIDGPRYYPYINGRIYNVIYWVKPGEEVHTNMSEGLIPIWNHQKDFLLRDFDVHNAFLNVEVQRLNSHKVDPATSSGRVVIGRARIPLPKIFGQRKISAFPLLRIQGSGLKFEGSILVNMRLERMKIDPTPFSLPMGFGRN